MKTCTKYLLTLQLLGIASIARAATVDDLKVCSHSYVMVADDYTKNGTGSRTKGGLFGDAFFLDVTGGSVATNKGATDLSVVDSLGADQEPLFVTQEIVDKYGEYGKHLQSLRLKNAQDVIAMRVTAGSKLIFFIQGNNKSGIAARIPKIATDAKMENVLNAAPDADFPATVTGFRYEWTADDDRLIYIGSYNGDMFVSYIIVEVNEAEGSPSVKVGEQTFENGLWYREVICRPSLAYGMSTIVTYTTDGTEPTTTSPVYTEPIKVYKDATLKFQAFMDLGTGSADASALLPGADNQANVNFKFDAPTIDVDGATVTITSPYEGAENYILVNGNNEKKANSITLEESATITAYSKIINGEYAEFTSNSTSQDVYVLNPIKEKKIITATGTVVLDEEASEYYTTPIYKVEGGAISANKNDFFVKNLTLNVLKDENAQYQVPEGQEIYIQMSNTNITFLVAEGDSVDVKVVCSKNSCKNLYSDDAKDRSCYVNVRGVQYCHLDADGNEAADLSLYSDANIIEFGLGSGYHTFQKYSGTGNIYVASIEITPVEKPSVNEIPKPELAWSNLIIVEEITKDVTQKPRIGYDADKVEVNLAAAIAKLGVSADVVQGELRQLLFAKIAYVTEDAVMGAFMSDSLTNESSAGGIGFWLRDVNDAEGNPTYECGRFAYDGDDSFYAEAFEYNAETGILSCNIGQMPNKLKGGNTYYTDLYIVFGDKAIKIRYNLIIREQQLGTLEDYEKAGESTMKVEMEPQDNYDTKKFSIDMETITTALGCTVGDIDDFYMLDSDINFARKNHEGIGYWVGIDGAVINWGNNAMFYITPKADDFSKFGIGQYPGHMNIGDSVRTTIYFLKNGKYYQLGIGLNIVASGKTGDVNCDDAIDVTDAVLIIDHILMKNPSNFDASLADVNNDGSIDVTDVVMVIDAILGKITLARGVEASQKDLTAYTAFQMDLTIPAGYVLEGVELTEIAKDSHKLAYNMLADGRCRVVVCSMNNEALPGAWDEVIRLNLRGQGEAQVNADRAVFVTVSGERHELLLNGTTGIAQHSTLNTQPSTVYDLQGRKVENTAKGLYIINGKKSYTK